jgi:hypothetical protein
MPIAIHLQPNTGPGDNEIKTAVYSPLVFAQAPEASAWQVPGRQEVNLLKEALEGWERFKKKYGKELGLEEGFDSAQPDREG